MADDTSVDTSTSEDVIFDNNGIYIPQNWQDTLEQFTVFSPERMNHIEQGIKKNSEKIKENWDSISQINPYVLINRLHSVPSGYTRFIVIVSHNAAGGLNGLAIGNTINGNIFKVAGASNIIFQYNASSRSVSATSNTGGTPSIAVIPYL